LNGEFLAIAYESGIVMIWSIPTGEQITTILAANHHVDPAYISFSHDSTLLAYSSDDENVGVQIYETETWTEMNGLQGFTYPVWTVAFSPDSTTLAFGGRSSSPRVWNILTNTLEFFGEEGTYIERLEFSTDGESLFTMSRSQGITRWSTLDWTLQSSEEYIRSRNIAVSPDGSVLVAAQYNIITLYDSTTFEEIREITLEGSGDRFIPVVGWIAISPDGERLALTSGENTSFDGDQTNPRISLWDMNTGELLQQADTARQLESVAFSPDGRLIATGDITGDIMLWDGQTLTFIAYFPVSRDEDDYFFNHATTLVFSTDSSLLICSHSDGTIRLWDVAAQAEIRTLEGHTYVITDLALSADGTMLASASGDGTVRLWGVP
jgi:WD40 repeat protein